MHAVRFLGLALGFLSIAAPASAQYSEASMPLPGATNGSVVAAAQIGRRLFIGGAFSSISPPTGTAIVVTPSGQLVPNAFPRFAGPVEQILPDSVGGWIVVGSFTSVDGQATPGFARVTPQRTVDPRYRISVDGPIRFAALAHGRIYFAGEFTRVNGQRRGGLAALSAFTGQLDGWGAALDIGGRRVSALSVSSIAVYLAAVSFGDLPNRLWGLDAASGALLFARTVNVGAVAATSTRVYVGGYGSERPVWAVHPLTGEDTGWAIGLEFLPQPGTYGDYTQINAMLLDEGRLFFAGRFSTSDHRRNVAAVEAEDGAPASWRFDDAPYYPTRLTRVGPAIVVSYVSSAPIALDSATAVRLGFEPPVYGHIVTMALAPEGVVIGGTFDGIGGTPRAGLASVNLDTGAIEPWTSALTSPYGFVSIHQLSTDGTWLFARTSDGRVAKIDPVTGAVLAERTMAAANATWPGWSSPAARS